jgi:alkylation response protein AidB-like acyl-CoA dehydrogenase
MGKPGLEEIRDLARRIATESLAPHAAETDRGRAFPRENYDKAPRAAVSENRRYLRAGGSSEPRCGCPPARP